MNEVLGPSVENFESVDQETEKKTGHNVEITASFRRHFDPKKDSDGLSLDELTDEGKIKAEELGSHLSGKVKGYASPKERALKTIDIAFQNVSEGAEIINQKLSTEQQQDKNREFNIRIKKELNTVPGLKDIVLKAKKLAKEKLPTEGEMSEYDFIVQYYLDHPEEMTEPGGKPHESAQDIAARVDLYRRMSNKLYDDSEVRLENGTHSPKLESFLREVLIRREGDKVKKGFDNVMEIGGALGPGENIEVVIRKDTAGQESMILIIRGQEYEIDSEAVKNLAAEYKERQAQKE